MKEVERIMEYKVGDKARVRKDLEGYEQYGGLSFTSEMFWSKGKEIEIVDVDDTGYNVKNGGTYIWTDEMLEHITLSTGDMLNELAKNPEARFRNERTGSICGIFDGSFKRKGSDQKGYTITFYPDCDVIAPDGSYATGNLFDRWTLVPPEPKPVPFMEAVKAYDEGKTIRCKHGCSTTRYNRAKGCNMVDFEEDGNRAIASWEILEGVWYIEEA